MLMTIGHIMSMNISRTSILLEDQFLRAVIPTSSSDSSKAFLVSVKAIQARAAVIRRLALQALLQYQPGCPSCPTFPALSRTGPISEAEPLKRSQPLTQSRCNFKISYTKILHRLASLHRRFVQLGRV